MPIIKLTQNQQTRVDNNLFLLLNTYKWFAVKKRKSFYAALQIPISSYKQKKLYLHHCVVGFPLQGKVVDHINGDTLDNRKSNLRIVDHRTNISNQVRKRNGSTSSKYTGVSLRKCNVGGKIYPYWVATIVKFGQRKFLGSFKTPKLASNAYLKELKEII